MKWKSVIINNDLGSTEPGAGFAPRKKEWLGLALAGASLASSIFGGIKSSKKQKEAERRLENEKLENEAWYNRRYNQSFADTASGQNYIRMAKDAAREAWQREAGAAAVGGGTDADVAAAKEAGVKMIGDTVAQMAATDTARKDNVDATYRAEKSRLNQQQIALDQQHAANNSQAASSASDALLTGALYFAGTKTPKTNSTGTTTGTSASNPGFGQSYLERMGTNSSNYKTLNPWIMQQLRGWGKS